MNLTSDILTHLAKPNLRRSTMKKGILLGIIGVFLILSACARHKAPSPPPAMPEAKDFNFYLKQGSWFLNHNDYGKAVIQFNKAIALKPDSARAHNLLGIAYFQQKEYKPAEEQFEKAIAINPSYAEALNNLGSVYFIRRQFDKAEEMFKKSLDLSPKLVSPYYSLGTLLIAQGKPEEALSYLSRGIDLDPEFLEKNKEFTTHFSYAGLNASEIYFNYAKLFASTGNVEKTLEYLKKASRAGFRDWNRVNQEKEFEKVRENIRIKEFLRRHAWHR
jgi:Flp pilus assembly protein TadD